MYACARRGTGLEREVLRRGRRMDDRERAFVEQVARHAPCDGANPTLIPGVRCVKISVPGEPLPVAYEPCLCLIVRGAKTVALGRERYRYARGEYLVVPVHLPLVGAVETAEPGLPYLCLQVDIDLALIGEMALEHAVSSLDEPAGPLFVGRAGPALCDALGRLAALLDSPDDASALAPLYIREVHYRLLRAEHGAHIARIACPGGDVRRLARVLAHISRHFAEPLRLADMAGMAGMSVSAFHQRFKALTACTPLQFQKRLRLIEARRLLSAGPLDAAEAAWRVGYESPSQFNREYSRMFGRSPGRDRARPQAKGNMFSGGGDAYPQRRP